jgi:hypothetical protein
MHRSSDSTPLVSRYTEITENTRCGGRTKERDVIAKGFEETRRMGESDGIEIGHAVGNRAKGAGHDEVVL